MITGFSKQRKRQEKLGKTGKTEEGGRIPLAVRKKFERTCAMKKKSKNGRICVYKGEKRAPKV